MKSSGIVATVLLFVMGLARAEGLRRGEPITPIPKLAVTDPGRVAIGQALFFDRRLSSDGSISCADCHRMDAGGADVEVPSRGVGGAQGEIKAPTVFNARFNVAQFWDGRAATLHDQLDGPITSPVEMNSSWPEIVARLKQDAGFVERFERVYPEGITEATLKDALVAFEESLITPDSPFDRWLRGDDEALTADEKEGYRLFKDYGCIACHQGVNVGGNLFQRMGVMGDYFADRGGAQTSADLGRFRVTGDEKDRHYFKVPSLRLVTLQKRFFHDGSADSLDQAIQIMGRYQLGRRLPAQDRRRIIAFLRSLVGTHPLLPAE